MDDTMKASLEGYAAAWVEVDHDRRRDLLERSFAEDGVYIDNVARASGREELFGLIEHFVTETLPGGTMGLNSRVDDHDGFARFTWDAHDASGNEILTGMDFVEFDGSRRIKRVVGFFGPL